MCVRFRGIGAGQCPFFSALNPCGVLNHSDRKCVRPRPVPAGRWRKIRPLNPTESRFADEGGQVPPCGAAMKRSGRVSAGSQRWRCGSCGASTTLSYDDTAARLDEFLAWLTSKDTQLSMPGRGRTFRGGRPSSGGCGPCPCRPGRCTGSSTRSRSSPVRRTPSSWAARTSTTALATSAASTSGTSTRRALPPRAPRTPRRSPAPPSSSTASTRSTPGAPVLLLHVLVLSLCRASWRQSL